MNAQVLQELQTRRLLREATEWRLLSLLFECPTGGWRDKIRGLAAEVTDEDLKAAVVAATVEASEGLYHSLFGPGGPAPAREISHRALIQPGYLMAELRSYYDAFSYHANAAEAVDHVAVEAGFLAYLRLKEAYAADCGDAEKAELTAAAAQSFMREHLAFVAEPLAAALQHSGVGYLALAGQALLHRAGSAKRTAQGQPLPILSEDDDCMFACGES